MADTGRQHLILPGVRMPVADPTAPHDHAALREGRARARLLATPRSRCGRLDVANDLPTR